MDLDYLLQQLATSLGTVSLELNENGVLSMQFEDDLVVNIEPELEKEICHLYCVLWRAPEDEEARLRLFTALLTANCFGHGTGGAAFSLDEQSLEILLGRTFRPERTTVEELRQWISEMIPVVEIWQRRLSDLSFDSDDDVPTEREESSEMMHFLRP
jgi:hypothetical protein